MFLKRMASDIQRTALFVGSIVTVNARQLKIADYGDTATRKAFARGKETQFALLKPDAYMHTGKIIDSIYQNGFIISKMKMSRFSNVTANRFLGGAGNAEVSQHLQSDVCTGMEIVADGAVQKWNTMCGPEDSIQAKIHASSSLRAAYGTDSLRNAVHGAPNNQQKTAEMNLWFSRELRTSALFTNCTCAVIKPHAIQAGYAGQIIDRILAEGFEISAMQMFHLDRPTAEEFFEIYQGVLPEFPQMTEQMTTGPCIAMEIRQENAVKAFRDLVGPMDPEIAKSLRPNTLRAQFGVDRCRNAIHCTDLPEDGQLESEYFFSIQQDE